MRSLALCVCVGLLGVGTLPAAPAPPHTRYILADRVLVADAAPDGHFHSDASLNSRFRARFEALFPKQVIELGPERLLTADEPAVLIVPRITAARVSHEEVAGVIHKYESTVVGDISAIDPWTGATLFAATRMVSAEVTLGQSSLGATDSDLVLGFTQATDRWIDACLSEIETKLTPFLLNAGTLAVPDQARKSPGGAWPFGSDRGVKSGLVLTGNSGHTAVVKAAFRSYSAIEDSIDSGRPIPAGESYFAMQVQNPTNRPEPRLAVEWLGPEPSSPSNLAVHPLSVDAVNNLFGDYVSKTSGLRVLPSEVRDTATKKQIQQTTEAVSRFSALAQTELITLHREALLQIAKQDPDYRVVLFSPASCYGERIKGEQVEHIYRLTLAAALFARHGEDTPQYALERVFIRNQQLVRLSQAGVREVDQDSAWFNLTRNAAIELSRNVLAANLIHRAQTSTAVEGEVGAGKQVNWPSGLKPPAHAPLQWLRPSGTLDAHGIGGPERYFRLINPSKGFLTSAVLPEENLKPGDVLKYNNESRADPVLGLRFEVGKGDEASWLPASSLELLVADRLAIAFGRQIMLIHTGEPSDLPDGTYALRVHLSALTENLTLAAPQIKGQWRVHLLLPPSPEPLKKIGLEADATVTPTPQLAPQDIAGFRLEYISKALDQLIPAIRQEGFEQPLSNSSTPAKVL